MTKIQWTEQTWNPTTGCDRVSPGCDHCYAMTLAPRLKAMGQAKYQRDGDPATSGPGFGITEHPDSLDEPLRWRKPRKVFVNSMSDVFHDGVSAEFVARIWATMTETPQHTYQVLTKRHGRMRSLLNSRAFLTLLDSVWRERFPNGNCAPSFAWPLHNVWLGTSVEDQKRAALRIPALFETPATTRFLSCEPLLGPVSLSGFDLSGLHWGILGGESGRGARPMDPSWVRDVIEQCHDQGVAVFVKQLGAVWAQDTWRAGECAAKSDPKGGDPAAWPRGLKVREYPAAAS